MRLATLVGQKRLININSLGGMVLGTNRKSPWDKQDPSLGPVPGTDQQFSVEFHSKIAILCRLSVGRVGVRRWNDCPARGSQKNVHVFCVYCSFRLQTDPQSQSLRLPKMTTL